MKKLIAKLQKDKTSKSDKKKHPAVSLRRELYIYEPDKRKNYPFLRLKTGLGLLYFCSASGIICLGQMLLTWRKNQDLNI